MLWRARLDLSLAFAVAFALLLLNVLISLTDQLRWLCRGLAQMRLTAILVNCDIVWLAALLWVAFARWRAAARKQAEFEHTVASITPDALLVTTPSRRVMSCNAATRRIFGYAEHEVLNATTDKLYRDHLARRDAAPGAGEAPARDEFVVGTATGRKKDGSAVPLEVITGEMSGSRGAVLLLRDISERTQAEEERRRLAEQAEQTAKLENLGMLAGGIAHDFNNLLMIIQGHTDLCLMNVSLASAVGAWLREIEKATSRATALCGRLVALSGRRAQDLRPLDLSTVIRDTRRLLGASMSKTVDLTENLADNLPPIHGDLAQVQQIVMNLKRRGIGVLITDHNVHETLAITDRSYLIHSGRLLKEGSAEFLANDEEARRIYLGESFKLDR